ncbi:Crp/Fnr family transcriptional regulator [Microvirga terrestris]|uniref:Crp/Fnr family transcriptional regulator n=1 Tax=Microvirga terrestris TaxID=2791024 RepID=A0ABS0HRC4_9HYPH|nr:Crp/Fnr family transcriptional regulator [Microvirga terrestris]MBF9196033.1 Crp/Fnr family transcriptional regulator [Microvirga terrestris]
MAQVRRTPQHQDNRLLAALTPEDFAFLEPNLAIVDLQRGQTLFEIGETIGHTYFPHDAMVSLVTIMHDGKSVEMATFGCEGLFGLVSAFVTRQSFGRYIVQLSGTASRAELNAMHEAMAARPAIQNLVLRFTEALMAQTLQSVACNAVHGVEARCCRWILMTQDRAGQPDLPLTQEFLAEMIGVQRSTVSDVARALQDKGLIRQGRGMITVTDRPGLEAASCECYAVIRQKFEQLLPHSYERG